MKRIALLLSLLFAAWSTFAQVPANLVVENVPAFPDTLVDNVRPYLEFRTASLSDWNPARREILILTRFADVAQLHSPKMPAGARVPARPRERRKEAFGRRSPDASRAEAGMLRPHS